MPSRRHRTGLACVPLGLLLLVVVPAGCDTSTSAGTTTPSSTASTRAGDGTGDGTRASSPAASPSESYGGYPSFLPSDTVGAGAGHQVVDASARRPALATQGDTVRVHVGTASVLVTVTGPAVPVAGQQYQAPDSPATWQVVVRGATAALPVDPATFQAVDEQGAVHDLELRGRVSRVVRPGQVERFKLFSPAFATGEGRLRWIPVGHLAPVEWDFVVETD